jgi:hypothetical protein
MINYYLLLFIIERRQYQVILMIRRITNEEIDFHMHTPCALLING